MRKTLVLLSLLLLTALPGCSGGEKGVIAVREGVIYNNGQAVAVTRHNGNSATGYASAAKAEIQFETHMNFNDCNHNPAGIDESQVTKYEGIEYFTMYLSSCITAHKKLDNHTTMCASMVTGNAEAALPVLDTIAGIMSSLDITTEYKEVNFEELVTVKNFDQIRVTPEHVTIPDTLAVMKDTTGELLTSGTAIINGVTVGVNTEDERFDFYKYGTVYVKAYKGVDISQWIYFK